MNVCGHSGKCCDIFHYLSQMMMICPHWRHVLTKSFSTLQCESDHLCLTLLAVVFLWGKTKSKVGRQCCFSWCLLTSAGSSCLCHSRLDFLQLSTMPPQHSINTGLSSQSVIISNLNSSLGFIHCKASQPVFKKSRNTVKRKYILWLNCV